MESGIVFSLDQAAPAHQGFLRTSENAVKTQVWVAVSVYVLVAIVKSNWGWTEPLQNFADSQRDRFRENSHFRRVFQLQRRVLGRGVLYAIESIRLLMGQH